MHDSGLLDGVTTNPSLIKKAGRDFIEVVKEIAAICPGPISAEVVALDHAGMMKEAEVLRKIADNIAIKVPLTLDGLKTCKALTDDGTFTTAERLSRVRGPMTSASTKKIETARRLFAEGVDAEALLSAVDLPLSGVTTPLMFEYQLMERARADRKHIVLPEGYDDRILRAAATVLSRGIADLTILGEAIEVRSRAIGLGLDISWRIVVNKHHGDLRVESVPGDTRFRVRLPLTAPQPDTEQEPS